MQILVSHPTGNSNVRALIEGFQSADILAEFHTTVAFEKDTDWIRIIPSKYRRELMRRSFPINSNYLRIHPWIEILRLVSQRLNINMKYFNTSIKIDNVYRNLDHRVALQLKNGSKGIIDAIYAYEDGAYQSFQDAKCKGIKCLYDLPTGHWRAHKKFLEKEKFERPEWSSTFRYSQDSEDKLRRKDQELSMADVIIVASKFTEETLDLFPGQLAPILLVPYGFPKVYKERKYVLVRNRKLKLLFVGGLTQSKGIANVFEAVENLKERVELTLVGRKVVQECPVLEKELCKHTWIPSLPNDEVLSLMKEQDILIFPSLFEGYGLVITEAMSQGTPVITTDRTCGRDFIRDGENGWLVKAGDSLAIVEKLKEILKDPECISRAGRAAMVTATRLSIETYGKRLVQALQEVIL